MKRIVLFVLCFVAFLGAVQAAVDFEETDKKVFFPTIPDRKTAETTLAGLLAEEFGEASILPDKLSEALNRLFSSDGIQVNCESLAHTLNSTKKDFEKQLDTLDRLAFFRRI